jgi:hypothetical protein
MCGRFASHAARLAIVLMLVSATARPEQPAAARTEKISDNEARRLFERGKEALRVGRFRDARADFERSLELVKKPSAAFNLAVALRGMGLAVEARRVLAQLLAGEYGELPAERRSAVKQLAREVRREIARLVVEIRGGPEAAVRVDGEHAGSVASGRPLDMEVNPGRHVITLSARLYRTIERRVTVGSGRTLRLSETLALSAAARLATLIVSSEDPTHTVEIVGVAAATGRVERRLAPGSYEVRVRSRDGLRSSQVTLTPGTKHRIVLDSPGVSVLDSPWFWIAAGTVVTGAAVGGFLLLRDRERDPITDPEFQVVQTLRRD